jgi:hypothetical protein
MVLYHIPMILRVKQGWMMVRWYLLLGLLVRHNAVYVIGLSISIVMKGKEGLTLIPHLLCFTAVY